MKKTITFFSVLISMLFIANIAMSQTTISGKWKTIDDETGKEKSVVQIWKSTDGFYYGKIMSLVDPEKQDSKCTECAKDDSRYNKPIIGMKIINKMKKDGNEWIDGNILDPNNGKIYTCKIWLEDGKLMLRGYIGPFFRTQTWLPIK